MEKKNVRVTYQSPIRGKVNLVVSCQESEISLLRVELEQNTNWNKFIIHYSSFISEAPSLFINAQAYFPL